MSPNKEILEDLPTVNGVSNSFVSDELETTIPTVKGTKRSFGGSLDLILDSKSNRVERQLEKKHLKAYLKGSKTFRVKGQMVVTKEIWS